LQQRTEPAVERRRVGELGEREWRNAVAAESKQLQQMVGHRRSFAAWSCEAAELLADKTYDKLSGFRTQVGRIQQYVLRAACVELQPFKVHRQGRGRASKRSQAGGYND
jgi:hypothetical protein